MIRRLEALAAATLVLGLLSAPREARAADGSATQDAITLKSGAAVQGSIVSLQRGVRVVIIESGKTRPRTIPWSQVRKVDRGKAVASEDAHASAIPADDHAADPAPPAAQPAPASPPASTPPTNGIRIHVDSPEPALLFSHEPATGTVDGHELSLDRATLVCTSPCDKVLDVDAHGSSVSFTANGDFTPSSSFTLGGQPGDVEVSLRPGSHGARVAGDVLVVGGAALTVAGAVFVLVGEALHSTTVNVTVDGQPSKSTAAPADKWLIPAGIGIGGTGVVALVGGLVALAASKTSIDVRPMTAADARPQAKAPRYWMGEF